MDSLQYLLGDQGQITPTPELQDQSGIDPIKMMEAQSRMSSGQEKANTEANKYQLDLIKAIMQAQKPSAEAEKVQYEAQTSPSNIEKQNLTEYLNTIMGVINPKNLASGGPVMLTPEQVSTLKAYEPAIQNRINDIQTTLQNLTASGTKNIDPKMANYYSMLQSEHGILNTLSDSIKKVSPKNPVMTNDSLRSVMFQAHGLLSQPGMDKAMQTNVGANLLQQLGMKDPGIKTWEDTEAYLKHLDNHMSAYMQPSQGGSIEAVNERLDFNSDPKKFAERRAGQAMADLVLMTKAAPSEVRNQLWGMLPLWAASKGLNWKNIQTQGVQHAEDMVKKYGKSSIPSPKDTSSSPISSKSSLSPDDVLQLKQVVNNTPVEKLDQLKADLRTQNLPQSVLSELDSVIESKKSQEQQAITDPSILQSAGKTVKKGINALTSPIASVGQGLGKAFNYLNMPRSQREAYTQEGGLGEAEALKNNPYKTFEQTSFMNQYLPKSEQSIKPNSFDTMNKQDLDLQNSLKNWTPNLRRNDLNYSGEESISPTPKSFMGL